jgi:2-polyprenyl-6-methoxyphenol hydroxylase-like FAD-dependent oxidoreductase
MHALICGAGIAGLALAQRLVHHGWSVTLIEQAPGPRTQGYMIDFFGPGFDAAERMGLLPRLRELGYDVEELAYVDDRGRRRAGADYQRLARSVDRRLLSIMRPDLEAALREHVEGAVTIRYGCSIDGIRQADDRVSVDLTDGDTLEGDVLFGADGIHSRVRELLFGPERDFLHYLGLHTAAYTFDDPTVHAQVQGTFALTDTVDRMMGLYALRDGRVAVFAVHRTVDPSPPADLRGALRSVYGSMGWVVPTALRGCPPSDEIYYDQVAQAFVPAWHRGRVALLGDACGAVSLVAGQGASLAVAGAYVLGERCRDAGSTPDALAGYETAWRPIVSEKQAAGRNGLEWFLPSSRRRLWLRRIALRLMALPGFDRYAAGALVGRTRVPLSDVAGDLTRASSA